MKQRVECDRYVAAVARVLEVVNYNYCTNTHTHTHTHTHTTRHQVIAVLVKCFQEIISIGYSKYKEYNLPLYRVLNW